MPEHRAIARIGIELIATVQQQVKGISRMLRRQVQPALVALPPQVQTFFTSVPLHAM